MRNVPGQYAELPGEPSPAASDEAGGGGEEIGTGVSPGTGVAAGVSAGDGDAGGPVYTGSPHIICCLIALYPGRPGRPELNTPPICKNSAR